ncbi:MAG: glutaredoxin family protein [Chloroflexota bacterium]|nr:glutaredoxin family protein [Chloroflexota bacterium]
MTTRQITLYTQPGCAESDQARAWLRERGVPFMERDVASDPEAAAALYATDVFATPLLVAGDRRVLGFRPQELSALLTEQGDS